MSASARIVVRFTQRTWLILAVAAVVIALDRWTKELVRRTIPEHDFVVPIPALGDYVVLEHVSNRGAAFGILQGHREFLLVAAAAAAVAMLVYAVRSLPPGQVLARVLLGLALGGGIGNAIDRAALGFVTDFVRVGIPGLFTIPNFNVADSAINCGVIGLAILLIWQDHRQSRRAPDEQPGAA